MNAQFIGSLVSLNCGDVLGTYQGQIVSVDSNQGSICIVNAYQNGIACSVPRITLNACDIHDLRIIKDASEARTVAPINKSIRLVGKDGKTSLIGGGGGGNGVEKQQAAPELCEALRLLGLGSQPSTSLPNHGGEIMRNNSSNFAASNGVGCAVYPDRFVSQTRKTKNNITKGPGYVNGLDVNNHDAYLRTVEPPNGCRPRSVNSKKSPPPPAASSSTVCNGLKEDSRSRSAGDFVGMTSTEFLNAATNSVQCTSSSRNRTSSACEVNDTVTMYERKSTTPRKDRKQSQQQQQLHQRKQQQPRDDCFSASIDMFMNDEFDFESNLALFDKRAVYSEIEKDIDGGNGTTTAAQSEPKYRCDENVLPGVSAVYRQIKVKAHASLANGGLARANGKRGKEFVTDAGLVVPSITVEAKKLLFSQAERYGFTSERRLEMIGRSTGEMVLQLLGGSNRFNPKNGHQRPVVVVVCSGGVGSAAGINCARQLANRSVTTVILMPDVTSAKCAAVDAELKLFSLTGELLTSKLSDITNTQVDLIVASLDCESDVDSSSRTWSQSILSWMNDCKAPVLSIDPPLEGGGITSKWCITDGLPLAYADQCGQVYLSDSSIPHQVYKEIGIVYRSPFAHKYVIPLYNNV